MPGSSSGDLNRAQELSEALSIIREKFPWEGPRLGKDPFFGLLGVVLSQHTSDRMAEAAEKNLEAKYPSIEKLAAASCEELARIIRPAGMQNQKACTIQRLAWLELQRSFTTWARSVNWQDARALLVSVEGVGEKTADVFCMVYLDAPLVPVDVHVRRVSMRLGMTSSPSYASVQRAIHALVPSELRKQMHLSMIRFGREICTSRAPKCSTCPVNAYCNYYAQNMLLSQA
ncbi:MAG: endonuclease III domain-containing protein [Thermoprotei archaeon]|nr:endonuclease III [TACK group archaeon]